VAVYGLLKVDGDVVLTQVARVVGHPSTLILDAL